MSNLQDQLQNVNVVSSDLLATPEEVKRDWLGAIREARVSTAAERVPAVLAAPE